MSFLNQLRVLGKWSNRPILKQLYSTAKIFHDIVGDNFYNSDHLAFQESLTKIINKEIDPYVDEWEAKGEFPSHEVFKKLGNAGMLGVTQPTEYGGLGLDFIYEAAVTEALSQIRADGIVSAIVVHSQLTTQALKTYGSDMLKKQFLVPTITGDHVSSVGVSEPGTGSDVSTIATNAVRNGDDLIINGTKMWITNGMQADWICLLANTNNHEDKHRNKSLICVPTNLKGNKPTYMLGNDNCLDTKHACSDTAIIYFDDVRVPQTYLIGEEGMGFTYQMLQFQEERIIASLSRIPKLFKAIQQTIDYCQQRQTFGKPVLHNQYVHFRLAELTTEVELLRALIYQTCKLYNQGHDVTKWASMCKLKAGRLSRIVADSCLQFWGGMGFTNDVDISRTYRDGRVVSIAGGSDEMMLTIISKYLNMLPPSKKKSP